ncbi:MAG: hypothetical protein HYZ53_16385 [Planctomycetes bacterium]|nr:hypothetical protein [Planctomycetota bacterium]
MKHCRASFAALAVALWLVGSPFAAAQEDVRAQVETLKGQVKKLEEQNRQMLELMKELQKRLEPAGKPAAPTPAAGSGAGSGYPGEPTAAPAVAQPPAGGAAATTPVPGKPPEDKNFLLGVVPTTWTVGNSKLRFYGFFRLDAYYNDSSLNNNLLPFFVRSEDSAAPRAIRADANNDGWSEDVRLTRLGLDLEGGEMDLLGKGKVSGKLEMDFDSGLNQESRAVPRIRHAYLKSTWGDLSVLAGQNWDVISPLWPLVNDHTLMWNAGNLGDRRPQFRVTYEPAVGPGKLSLRSMVGLSGAIDNNDRDASGNLDGVESGRPIFEQRLGYAAPLWVEGQNLDVGVWGHTAWEEVETPIAGETEFFSWSVGMDLTIPIVKDLAWKTEIWQGENLPDVRGGINQGINVRGEEIEAHGGWTELSYKPCSWLLTGAGFTMDDPANSDVDNQGRETNWSYYMSNTFYPGANVSIKLNYIHWVTQWKGLGDGEDNRFELIFQYNW